MVGRTKSKESATRKKIDAWLNNLGWNTDEETSNCNVFTERLKLKNQQKKLEGKEPDYSLYKSNSDEIIAIVEAKRKGEDLEGILSEAIEKYVAPLSVPIIFVTDGTFVIGWHIDDNERLKIDGDILTSLVDEKTLLRFINEGANISEVSDKVQYTREQLISIFKWANDLLRKEGIREGFDRFIEFANLLFLKLISEMERERERNGEERILEKKYCWDSFNTLPAETMMSYINDTVLPYLVLRYNHSGDVFQHKMSITNPKTLKKIVDRLDTLSLINTESDIKGDAFEYFLKNSVTVGNDLGEYFTPKHIISFMVKIVNPQFGDKVYDPACGTGGFLIESFKYIKRYCKPTKENMKKLREDTIFGGEITNTARIAKMNMILTGDGHTNIKQIDSLKNPIKNKYDVILANPPYGTTTDNGDYYQIPSKNGDVIFPQHMLKALKENGRMAFIMQEGFFFRSGIDLKLRKYIIENYRIDAIISLPKGVFLPYTPVKTYILFISNKKPTKKIWCYKIENDGYELTGLRKKIPENDIPDMLEKWTTKEEGKKSWFIDVSDIKENKYSLIPEDYNEKYRFKLEQAENYVPDNFIEIQSMMEEITDRIKKLKQSYELDFLENENIKKYRIKDLFLQESGGTPSRDVKDYFGGSINWVKVGDLPGSTRMGYVQPQNIYIEETEEKLTEEGYGECGANILPKGTVLVAIFANAGKTGILNIDACTNQAIVGLIPKEKWKDKLIPEFVYYMILANRDVLEDIAKGGTQTNINKTKLGNLNIPVPPKKTQEKVIQIMNQYSSELYDLFEQKNILEKKLRNLYNAILVDTLLKQKINQPAVTDNEQTSLSNRSQ
ncbi:MAG: N-6 DNA methylase [Candidatus Thermoplasmatota archaeon]